MSKKWVLSLFGAWILVGCNVLPSDENHSKSPWKSFDEAKTAFDLIIPNKTTVEELKALKYDPYTTPNVSILTYVDIIKEFIPNQSIKVSDVDPAIQQCIKVRERCFAYEVKPHQKHSSRHGNVLLDLLGFRKKTETTGWKFDATIVMIDDKVVYKIWGGSPMSIEHKDTKKPLGPLQSEGLGGLIGL